MDKLKIVIEPANHSYTLGNALATIAGANGFTTKRIAEGLRSSMTESVRQALDAFILRPAQPVLAHLANVAIIVKDGFGEYDRQTQAAAEILGIEWSEPSKYDDMFLDDVLKKADALQILSPDEMLFYLQRKGMIQPSKLPERKKRGGGPPETPIDEQIRIVEGWFKVKGKMPKDVYAGRQGVDQSTIWRWEKELKKSGLL